MTQAEDLTSAIDSKSKTSLRDKLIIHLLFSSGLKISEIVSLERQDISPNFRQLTIRKKGSVREILISESSSLYLEQYLTTRIDNHHSLFVNYSNTTLTPRSIQRMLKSLSSKLRIQTQTPSTIRNNFANQLFESGKNHSKIQDILGLTNKGSVRNLKKKLNKD